MLEGNDVAVRRAVALMEPADTMIAVDLRRYDKWVVDAARAASGRGAWIAAVTDSLLSPLAEVADHTFTVAAAGGGPFDSHVGTLAFANLVVAGVADRLRAEATHRLDRAEAAWSESGSLTDR
jgi:DNA-binding MurR/RpiR family transcriptional regulator